MKAIFQGFKKIPDKSINLALIDPPYNLAIKYGHFRDQLEDKKYITWSKGWIDEISRTLKPGGILFLVNIPKWSIELFPYIQKQLTFQGWIVWDAWSVPTGRMVPAHYPILCFSKGKMKQPFNNTTKFIKINDELFDLLRPLNYGYCIRGKCVRRRTKKMKNDRRALSDLWTDIHRIRHNSFRYNTSHSHDN